ncbi:ABC transporter permease [Nitriliruptor alkaliphilus]|uniref:ABC transporter permease n=1 Tax=Nitriliruptor alkaliphilus TaxID=427918 RepID=UPI000697BA01|nr:ABC transporter permease subunit [Nitriliruptor alkaliphilus]
MSAVVATRTRQARRGQALIRSGVVILVVVIAATLLAPWVSPHDPAAQLVGEPFGHPSREHLFGTDRFGRDVLSRVLHGGRETLLLTGGTMVAIIGLGVVIGASLAGAGRRLDNAACHVIDMLIGFPAVVVALAFVGLRGPGLTTVLTGVLLVWWAPFARLSRSLVRSALSEPSAVTMRALGAGRARILRTEVWPRLRGPLLVLGAIEAGQLISVVAGLSFLGLGAQPPSAEWGAMLQDGRSHLVTKPYLVLAPGAAVFVTVLGLSALGEGLRDRMGHDDLGGRS